MKQIINFFDLYGKRVTLYTKSSSKATTCTGFLFSIASIMLFGLILYIECYEIFKREHPNVISYRQNTNKYKSTLSISKSTFNFYINIITDFQKPNYLSYLNIVSHIRFNQEVPLYIKVFYEECNQDDKINFGKYIGNFDFSNLGINLCPRINYTELESVGSLSDFNFNFDIVECTVIDHGCTVNEEFYKKIRNKQFNMRSKLKFINSQIDLMNYEDPYWFEFKTFYSYSSQRFGEIIELDSSEIISQTLFSFNSPTIQNQFSTQRDYILQKEDYIFISYLMTFQSSDMYIYKRNYKTFNVSIATSFALFKLFNQIITIMLSPIYTYFMNTIIINNNFEYGLDAFDNKETSNRNNLGKS
jgi:hypothetical protein